jgi:hypothetical protein
MSITDQDIIEYGQNHLFAYTDYQIQNYVINTGITDHRKTRQALLEIEQRTNSLIDLDFLIRKHHANIEIKKEELAAETGTAKKQLIQVEIDELEFALKKCNIRKIALDEERTVFLNFVKNFITTKEDLDKVYNDPEEDKQYWISRMSKQAAVDLLSYGKVSAGNMESIIQMPVEDQVQTLAGAIEFNKKMETGLLALQRKVETQLLEDMKTNMNPELLPNLEKTVKPYDTKNLLGTSEPKT